MLRTSCTARVATYLSSIGALLAISITSASCSTAAPPPKVPPYNPTFSYAMPQGAEKVAVTIGLVAPQFTGDGAMYWTAQKSNEVTKSMVRGLRTSFTELFVAKGFNTAGPFDSVDNMTFPEKKGSDFVLYPDVDLSAAIAYENVATKQEGNALTGEYLATSCDAIIKIDGAVSLIVKEPLSGEKMWVKKIDVSRPPEVIPVSGQAACTGQELAQKVQDAWAKAHEETYKTVMSNLDKYVTAEEFVTLKTQADELRSKKVY